MRCSLHVTYVGRPRLRSRLYEKAASLTADRDRLSYAICAREAATHTDPDILAITADDIFSTGPI